MTSILAIPIEIAPVLAMVVAITLIPLLSDGPPGPSREKKH
jgi:hypothetical protein